MKKIYNNMVVFLTALVPCAYSWIFGGTYAPYVNAVMPWVTLLMLEAMLFFPQHYENELIQAARARVWRGLRKDPLAWVIVAFLVLLTVPFVNAGLCPVCDYPRIIAGENPEPFFKFLPFCVNRAQHYGVFMWFLPTLTAVLSVKHACTKRGKRLLMEILLWNGFALAILGAVQVITGAEAPLWADPGRIKVFFFSTFGYPNMAGCFFAAVFSIGFALWRRRLDEINERLKHEGRDKLLQNHLFFWKKHYLLIPTTVAYFAAINTLSRATTLLVTMLALLFFVHTATCILVKMKSAKRFKVGVVSALSLGLVVFFGICVMPDDIRTEVDTIDTREVLDRMTGKSEDHVAVATRIWQKHPFFGVGGWGYWHFRVSDLTERDEPVPQMLGGGNVHNDYLQFLVEHGVAGALALAGILLLLLTPVLQRWKELVASIRFSRRKTGLPSPIQIFALPAAAFFILLGAIATMVHAVGDCPLRSPAILSMLLLSIAAIDGFLPESPTYD